MKRMQIAVMSVLVLCCIGWAFSVLAAKYDPLVEKAQQRLSELGYDVGTVDGKIGQKTIAAIKKFQADQGLTVTGELNEETVQKLGVSESKQSQPATTSTQPVATGGKPEIEMIDQQVVVNSQREVIVGGKGFTDLVSMAISPADNLVVKQIKKVDLAPKYTEAGFQGWAILISADNQAAVGSRDVVLTTSHGTIESDIRVNQFDFQIAGIKLLPQSPGSCTAEYEIELIMGSKTFPPELWVKWMIVTGTSFFFSNVIHGTGTDSLIPIKGNRYRLAPYTTQFSGISGCRGSHKMWLSVSADGIYASAVATMNWDLSQQNK